MGKKYFYKVSEAMSGRLENYGTDHPNPTILKMGKMVSSRLLQKHAIDGYSPDYFGPAGALTEEMAEIALKMKVRKPKTLDEIAELANYTSPERKKYLEDLLEQMCYLGFCEFSREYPDHQKRYYIQIFIIGSGEMSAEHPEWQEDHPEFTQFFGMSTFLPFMGSEHWPTGLAQFFPEGGGGVGMHVIPVEKAIEHENQSVSIEQISHWLDKYDTYMAIPCVCRMERTARGDGCTDDPNNWCLVFGEFAKYCKESKKPGHYIDRDEVLRILQRAEDLGFVHQIINQNGPEKTLGLCNCDPKTCNALRLSQLYNTPNLNASAYRARVDPKNCVACGRCVEYCPAGAVKLGRKLKLKDGSTQNYPCVDDSNEHIWLKNRWNPDYRNTNREETRESGTAPCKSACPAHIAIQGYLQLAKDGHYNEALELIKRENPFPAVCGRVCNKKCEAACTRGTIDEAVSIDEVKKYIAQRDLFAETRFIPQVNIESNQLDHWNEKIAIIGAGPAGLTCANYLAAKGYKPTVFEKHDEPGGMMVYGIPSYKLQKDVVAAEIDVIRKLGVEIKCGVEVGKDITIQELRDQGYKAFYLAIGLQASRKAGVAGEDAGGIVSAVDHLAKVHANPGMKVPANVVVIGGGNVAIDAARTSARLGGENVSMFCLETRDIMPAADEEAEEAEAENIRINCGWGPKEFKKDENGNLTSVVFEKCIRVFDENHKFSPQYDKNEIMEIPADYCIEAIGQSINWGSLLEGEDGMEYVHGNYPKADKVTFQTGIKDIFVGGDLYHGPSFVINAIAEGHEAAESLNRFVRPTCDSLTTARPHHNFFELDKSNISIESYDTSKRQQPEFISGIDRAKTFEEYKKCFTEEQIKIETNRCLSCGASVVDEVKCIGCGLCTTKCSFDAIHLFRTHPHGSDMYSYEQMPMQIAKNIPKRFGKITIKAVRNTASRIHSETDT